MLKRLLAIGALLTLAGIAGANYAVIIYNLNPAAAPPAGGEGGGPAMGGLGPPMGGGRGGGGPMGGLGPPMGGLGPPMGGLGPPMGGMVPPMGGGRGGSMPPMGGSMPPMGGGSPGLPGGGQGAEDIEDAPDYVVTVLSLSPAAPGGAGLSKLATAQGGMILRHAYKGTIGLASKTSNYEVIPLTNDGGKLIASVKSEFNKRFDSAVANKENQKDTLSRLAKWALGVGLQDQYVQTMDKLAEVDKDDKAVVAFQKVRAELAKPTPADTVSGRWKAVGMDGYKVTAPEKSYYAVLHSADDSRDAQAHADRLDFALRNFYYWWALQGEAVPLPKERLVAVLTDRPDDFTRLHKHLSSGKVFTASFHAGREGVSVYKSRRDDEPYRKLDERGKTFWQDGFNKSELLASVSSKGVPKKGATDTPEQMKARSHEPRTIALLLRSMDDEWQRTTTSHEAAVQLFYATGMLPRNVHVPEWLQFGLGAFYETPLQSPWGGAGGPSPYWLPRFKQWNSHKDRAKRYGANDYETMMSVVTDAIFAGKPPAGTQPDVFYRKNRAAAWALVYFLASARQAELKEYFRQLNRLPRDVALDDKILREAFARAFGCVNADGSENRSKLETLARQWVKFVEDEKIESENTLKKVRDAFSKVGAAPTPTTPRTPPSGGGGFNPGRP